MCEVNGDLASWKVNGTLYNSLSVEIRRELTAYQESGDSGSEILTLTIPGRIGYNGTSVQCVTAELGGEAIESETVTMKVQGIY